MPRDTNEIKVLTVARAEVLAEGRGRLALKGVAALTPDIAIALSKHDGDLPLDGSERGRRCQPAGR